MSDEETLRRQAEEEQEKYNKALQEKVPETQILDYKKQINAAKLFSNTFWFYNDLPSGWKRLSEDDPAIDTDFHYANNRYINYLIAKSSNLSEKLLAEGLSEFGLYVDTPFPEPAEENTVKKFDLDSPKTAKHSEYYTESKALYLETFRQEIQKSASHLFSSRPEIKKLYDDIDAALVLNQVFSPYTLPLTPDPPSLGQFKKDLKDIVDSGALGGLSSFELDDDQAFAASFKYLLTKTQKILKSGEALPERLTLDPERKEIEAAALDPQYLLYLFEDNHNQTREMKRAYNALDESINSSSPLPEETQKELALKFLDEAYNGGAITPSQYQLYADQLYLRGYLDNASPVTGVPDEQTYRSLKAFSAGAFEVESGGVLGLRRRYKGKLDAASVSEPSEDVQKFLYTMNGVYAAYARLSPEDQLTISQAMQAAPAAVSEPPVTPGGGDDGEPDDPDNSNDGKTDEDRERESLEAEKKRKQELENRRLEREAAEKERLRLEAESREKEKLTGRVKELQKLRREEETGLYTDVKGRDNLGSYIETAYQTYIARHGRTITASQGDDDPGNDVLYYVNEDNTLSVYENGAFVPLNTVDANGKTVQARTNDMGMTEESGRRLPLPTLLVMEECLINSAHLDRFEASRLEEMVRNRDEAVRKITGPLSESEADALWKEMIEAKDQQALGDLLNYRRKTFPDPDALEEAEFFYLVTQIWALNHRIGVLNEQPDYSALITDPVTYKDYHEMAAAYDIAKYAGTGKVGNIFGEIQSHERLDYNQIDDRFFHHSIYAELEEHGEVSFKTLMAHEFKITDPDALKKIKKDSSELYEALTHEDASELAPYLENMSFSRRHIGILAQAHFMQEAANRGIPMNEVSDYMSRGEFNPYFEDLRLAREGFGRIPFSEISKDLVRFEIEINLRELRGHPDLWDEFNRAGVITTRNGYTVADESKITTQVMQKLWNVGILDDTDLYGENERYWNQQWNKRFGTFSGKKAVSTFKNGEHTMRTGHDYGWDTYVRWHLPEDFERIYAGVLPREKAVDMTYEEAKKELESVEAYDVKTILEKYKDGASPEQKVLLTKIESSYDRSDVELYMASYDMDAEDRDLLQGTLGRLDTFQQGVENYMNSQSVASYYGAHRDDYNQLRRRYLEGERTRLPTLMTRDEKREAFKHMSDDMTPAPGASGSESVPVPTPAPGATGR